MRLRILHVVEALGVGGGIENGIANLIEQMDSRRFEHVLCAVFRMGPAIERYFKERATLVCLAQKSRRFSVQAGPLARLIRQVKPQVVHSRNWGALEAVLGARLAGQCAVIHSEHGLEMDPYAEPKRRSLLRRVAFEMADRVFSVSEQLRQRLAERTGFPARRIGVIHNGVDTARFAPDPDARLRFRRNEGVSEAEFCIGCVGRLSAIKDYRTMLLAAEKFATYGCPWRLFFAGEGAELQRLQEFVNERPLMRERVRFLGGGAPIAQFLNALDAYVLPSLCEGISNSLLEAMATGLPVIATNTGGNPELVVDGQSGLLFAVGDHSRLAEQLLGLWRQPELRRELGGEAMERARKHFSLSSMVDAYQRMYLTLAGEPLLEERPASASSSPVSKMTA